MDIFTSALYENYPTILSFLYLRELLLVMGILVVAVIMFVSERLRVDLIAMLVLIALSLTGLVTLDEAFSGFGSR